MEDKDITVHKDYDYVNQCERVHVRHHPSNAHYTYSIPTEELKRMDAKEQQAWHALEMEKAKRELSEFWNRKPGLQMAELPSETRRLEKELVRVKGQYHLAIEQVDRQRRVLEVRDLEIEGLKERERQLAKVLVAALGGKDTDETKDKLLELLQ